MPETTMNENNLASGWKNQVRFAGEVLLVEAVPKTKTVYKRPNGELDSGVFPPD
jgi:hypothetical protein